jgi:hypothetical protein
LCFTKSEHSVYNLDSSIIKVSSRFFSLGEILKN